MNIEQLELLPKFCNHRQYHKHWDYERTSPKYHGENIFTLIERILQNNIGKSWSMTYHYICKKIPKNLKYYFYNSTFHKYYYIENDILHEIKYKRRKSIPSLRSEKFETKYYYKDIELEDNFYLGFVIKGTKKQIKVPRWEVEKKCIYEWEILKTDKEYKKLKYELFTQKKKYTKKHLKEQKEKSYSFLTKEEVELKKEKEINKWKIIKHGFDENSFRTNPSLQ